MEVQFFVVKGKLKLDLESYAALTTSDIHMGYPDRLPY